MYGSLDISTSALIAQRTRMDVISANLANKDVILNENGDYEPFRRRVALLGPGDPSAGSDQGVHVQEIRLDSSPLIKRYQHQPRDRADERDGSCPVLRSEHLRRGSDQVDAVGSPANSGLTRLSEAEAMD